MRVCGTNGWSPREEQVGNGLNVPGDIMLRRFFLPFLTEYAFKFPNPQQPGLIKKGSRPYFAFPRAHHAGAGGLPC